MRLLLQAVFEEDAISEPFEKQFLDVSRLSKAVDAVWPLLLGHLLGQTGRVHHCVLGPVDKQSVQTDCLVSV